LCTRFAHYISRIGYTDEGRIYSIICPQQGVYIEHLGITMNLEVTVKGQRGWTDETAHISTNEGKVLAADMIVTGTVWFTTDSKHPFLHSINKIFEKNGKNFPWSKKDAIIVKTGLEGDPNNPVFPVRSGQSTKFEAPDFAKHDEAWFVGNIEVQIDEVEKHDHPVIDDFNQMIVDVFNLAAGNMLKKGNLLTWNIWCAAPDYVDQKEWQNHANYWRTSIDEDHRSPGGARSDQRYFDGSEFHPKNVLGEELEEAINKLFKESIQKYEEKE